VNWSLYQVVLQVELYFTIENGIIEHTAQWYKI